MNRNIAIVLLLLSGLAFPAVASAELLYSTPFTGATGTQPAGFSTYADPNMRSQIDSNEYEQAWTASNGGTAVAFFNDPVQTAGGVWRDVTVTAQTRFSGHPLNKNGILLRGRNIAGTSSGDYYHVRMEDNNLVLYRFNNGTPTNLATAATTESIAAAANRYLRFSAVNIPNPANDFVQLRAEISKDAAFTQIIGTLNYLDTSTSAITRAGTVGLRSNNTNTASTRAVFDNLTAVGHNPELLWYDDFVGNAAPGFVAYPGSRSMAVTAGKYEFSGNGTAIGKLNVPDTAGPEWTNVEVSALMRYNSGGAADLMGGLIFAESDTVGATGSGDFYMYRLGKQGGAYRAHLYRSIGGTFTQIGGNINLTSALIPESTNIFMKALKWDAPDGVHIQTWASLSSDFSNPFGMFDFLDNSASAIYGPGGAGFRVFGNGTVNFDNFTVMAIPEPVTGLAILLAGGVLTPYLRRRRGC